MLWFVTICAASLVEAYARGEREYNELTSAGPDDACFASLGLDLREICPQVLESEGDDVIHQYAALRLTSCYLELTGLSPVRCCPRRPGRASKLRACIRTLGKEEGGTGVAVFVHQLGRIFDLCVYLEASAFQRRSASASRDLLASSERAHDALITLQQTAHSTLEELSAQSSNLQALIEALSDLALHAVTAQEQLGKRMETLDTALSSQTASLQKGLNDALVAQESAIARVGALVESLEARLDIIHESLNVTADTVRHVSDELEIAGGRLSGIAASTNALQGAVETLTEEVERHSVYVAEVHKEQQASSEALSAALESVEHQARQQTAALIAVGEAVERVTTVGFRPFHILGLLEKRAPGGVVWHLGGYVVARASSALCHSGDSVSLAALFCATYLVEYAVGSGGALLASCVPRPDVFVAVTRGLQYLIRALSILPIILPLFPAHHTKRSSRKGR
ncbi:hypothetical protein GMRT_20199 [Giardia muris]|uniref:Uncharacterized protein n=1 Tax=Giardia muris TaxID=5742 RepID=A0A4Z1T138_GIAMU|nr:hypothetical protein GMRT_20199 [Giardia muris]|eukprot:TNJ29418.1 hypothetical protein GMRT_20199 [Giardia muris]